MREEEEEEEYEYGGEEESKRKHTSEFSTVGLTQPYMSLRLFDLLYTFLSIFQYSEIAAITKTPPHTSSFIFQI